MHQEQTRSGTALWLTVLVALLAIYVLSFGPACWASSRINTGAQCVSVAYRPITALRSRPNDCRTRAATLIRWFSRLGASGGWEWVLVSETCSEADAKWSWGPVPIF